VTNVLCSAHAIVSADIAICCAVSDKKYANGVGFGTWLTNAAPESTQQVGLAFTTVLEKLVRAVGVEPTLGQAVLEQVVQPYLEPLSDAGPSAYEGGFHSGHPECLCRRSNALARLCGPCRLLATEPPHLGRTSRTDEKRLAEAVARSLAAACLTARRKISLDDTVVAQRRRSNLTGSVREGGKLIHVKPAAD
jgi:hypothetical protein